MIVTAGLTSEQIEVAGLLGLAVACSAAFALAFLLLAEARRLALGWWCVLAAGFVAGSAGWFTLAMLRLIDGAPPQALSLVPMMCGLVLAVAGGIGATSVLAHRVSEWPQIGAGLLLGAALPVAGLFMLASEARIAEMDAVAFVVASVCTLAAAAAAVLISEMGLGRWRLPAAGSVLTLAVFGAHFAGGGAAVRPTAGVGGRASEIVATGLPGALVLVLVLVGAVAAVALACITRVRRVQADDALRRAAELAMARRVRAQLEPLTACLDLMSAETLPLSQRSRLDIARACAGDLGELVAGAGPQARECEGAGLSAAEVVVSGPSVLVVDEALHRAVTGEMLRRLGASVAVAASAPEALACLRAAAVDVVLVNADMPGVDAFGLTEAIRANAVTADVVVVGLSANPAEDRAEAADCGMDDIVASPLTRDRLVALIERWAPCESVAAAPGPGVAEASGMAGSAQLLDLAKAKVARRMFGGADRSAAIDEMAVGSRAR